MVENSFPEAHVKSTNSVKTRTDINVSVHPKMVENSFLGAHVFIFISMATNFQK
jgi:hypothetical protein